MSDTLTILGNVATDPTQSRTPSGIPVTNFRVASTHRRLDPATQTWVDASTNWYSVAAFRQLGEHAKASLRCGDSVIVTGRLKIRTWESNGKSGTSIDIDADAIGHDLRRGTTAFLRASRAAGNDGPSRGAPDAQEREEQEYDAAENDHETSADPTSRDDDALALDTSWSIAPARTDSEAAAGVTY
ncbi:Single-stranded DNA-binding protein 1 [Microbacterium oxydans]|uniref:Single-stranded DNA-binding protein n=1 Tax=Microbacterium oxydans TaxID=82380 RepID=A0A0F0L4E0_9MICO|nr:single-stranded DNA-binding protein [Microbacterium oxydans]KJL28023.1 Single-stranded DNA-binding protein 1 [Microbacterium oxydans]CAH0143284.1 Single-stranded DNA-binding protein 1 [Microbacterium oxydans]